MGLPRFYIRQDIEQNVDQEISPGKPYKPGKALTHYLRNVLRVKPGDQITLFNGQGGEFLARIEIVLKREVTVSVIEYKPTNRESELQLRLGVSIVKRDAMDSIIQKSTELGVTEIHPLVADLTTVSAKAIRQRSDHWQGIVISACEQCGRNTLPVMLSPMTTGAWISSQKSALKLAMDPSGKHSLMDKYFEDGVITQPQPAEISVLIGPEGGLSDTELKLAEMNGFLTTSLGKRILRADTAPLSVLSIIQARFGDFSASAKATLQTSDST